MDQAQELHQRVAAGLSRIGLVMRHHTQGVARAHGLTPLQAQALGVLRGRPAGLRVGELAGELAVTNATVSDALSTLTSKVLVAKESDPEDHRAVRLVLTRKGKRVAEETTVWPDFLRSAVDRLPTSEAEAFLRVLVGMIRNLEKAGEIPISRMCTSCRFFAPNRHGSRKKPHHCELIDAPIGNGDLRFDCGDFEEAVDRQKQRNEKALSGARRERT